MSKIASRIFCLELQRGNWFVGRATQKDLDEVIAMHINGEIPGWTSIYGPGTLSWTEVDARPTALDAAVKREMFLRGTQSVRGGSYHETKLSEAQNYCLEKEMRTAKRYNEKTAKPTKEVKFEVVDELTDGSDAEEEATEDDEEEDEDDSDFIDDECEEMDKSGSSSEEEADEEKAPEANPKKRKTKT